MVTGNDIENNKNDTEKNEKLRGISQSLSLDLALLNRKGALISDKASVKDGYCGLRMF